MNTTSDKPAEPKPLSEFAAHIKRTMTADELYAMLMDDDKDGVPAEVVLKEITEMVEAVEDPLDQ